MPFLGDLVTNLVTNFWKNSSHYVELTCYGKTSAHQTQVEMLDKIEHANKNKQETSKGRLEISQVSETKTEFKATTVKPGHKLSPERKGASGKASCMRSRPYISKKESDNPVC